MMVPVIGANTPTGHAGANAAPFLSALADGPDTGHAIWLTAGDGTRLRLGLWPHDTARGTVLLLPGRTEYIEKYGRAARDLAARGFATIAIDWRSQGLADRPGPVRRLGHVNRFSDFQHDLDAVLAALPDLCGPGLPIPRLMLAHSMGGCIALRGLLRGTPQSAGIRAAAFTGPMWDIAFRPPLRPLARLIARTACSLGQGARFAPGTDGPTYVMDAPFKDNTLTSDRTMWDYMRAQINGHPDLALSGPSLRWLDGALAEADAFRTATLPDIPTLVTVGRDEAIVSVEAIEAICARWPGVTLDWVEGARHEIMMETPDIRTAFFDRLTAFMDAYRG